MRTEAESLLMETGLLQQQQHGFFLTRGYGGAAVNRTADFQNRIGQMLLEGQPFVLSSTIGIIFNSLSRLF
jgi:hypothetical protein